VIEAYAIEEVACVEYRLRPVFRLLDIWQDKCLEDNSVDRTVKVLRHIGRDVPRSV